ncbi:hypothetical protein BIW11_03886 [Tropilaelaps mercedesae]|uniref:Uncharacterized protein n=1 Tax=Tropilaelaps mercedesae TaxID=418985 RepID=A0A1V9XE99_9ACAR|nr:hypothetical protein BIW11_03886 [Tropilaelaps mercedesae]
MAFGALKDRIHSSIPRAQ